MAVEFRPIQKGDEDFLYKVYASTRSDELAVVVDWDEQQKESFLKMQFSAQHQYYLENYTNTEFLLVLLDEIPVGRFYVARRQEEIRIVDLALLPPYRNAGIGTSLLKKLFAEAEHSGKAVRIHVEKFNPALRLYERLGFKAVADKGVYWFMEWTPAAAPSQLNTAS